MAAQTGLWQGMYDVEGCGGFKEGAPSVSELVQGLLADSGPLDRGEADALSAPIVEEGLVAAVRKLKYGCMVGPDGVRGKFLKGLHVETLVFHATLQEWVVVHMYDISPGSVLGDLCTLSNAVFDAGEVLVEWCGAFLSAVFKKRDPTVLDNYRGIAVGSAPNAG